MGVAQSDKVFRAKADNVAALRKLLAEFGVPGDIPIDTHGGATWEFNALVNLVRANQVVPTRLCQSHVQRCHITAARYYCCAVGAVCC